MSSELSPVVFLDRDGVINVDLDEYVKSVEELTVFPFVPDCIRMLNDAGYKVVVVSNQQCVAKGMMSLDDLRLIEEDISDQVRQAGGCISAFYYCVHLKSENCNCRKPKSGMLEEAAEELNLDTQNGFMVGDNEKDVVAGKGVGCKTVLVLSGMANEETVRCMQNTPDFVARDLEEAVDWILRNLRISRE